MTRLLAFLLVFTASVQGADNYLDIPWGTSFEEVSGTYDLQPLDHAPLKESNRLYLTWDFAKHLGIYIAVDGQDGATMEVKGSKLTMMLFGFHENKLIYTIIATDEMRHNEENENKHKFLVEEMKPDSCELLWQPVFKVEDHDGTIFNEGAYAGMCENDRTYYECQQNTGSSLLNPTHLQFTMYHLDKTFFDELTQSPSYRMKDELKEDIPAHRTFTRFITKRYRESMKKSLGDKK